MKRPIPSFPPVNGEMLMPCEPDELPDDLQGALPDPCQETAAHTFLRNSRNKGCWVGMSGSDFLDHLNSFSNQRIWKFVSKKKWYQWLCRSKIHPLTVRWEHRGEGLNYSGTDTDTLYETDFFRVGIHRLIESQMVLLVPGKKPEATMIFPTPLLVSTLMKHQARQQVRS